MTMKSDNATAVIVPQNMHVPSRKPSFQTSSRPKLSMVRSRPVKLALAADIRATVTGTRSPADAAFCRDLGNGMVKEAVAGT